MRLFLLAFLATGLLLPLHSHAQAVMRNGDIFDLRLSGMAAEFASEFSLPLTVGDHGEVRVPYIGELKAAGLSTTEFARSMEKKLIVSKIFTEPTVVVTLQPTARSVTVGGAVRAPQAVPWNNDLTLSSAIKRAGDFSEFGKKANVKVTRDGQASYYNLKRSDRDPTQNPKLLPADEVTVAE